MRWRALALLAALLLLGAPAFGAGKWSTKSVGPGGTAVFTWGSADSGDQEALDVRGCGRLSFTAEITSGTPSVAFYLVPTATTATSSGTSVFVAAALSRTEAGEATGGPYYLRPDVDTAGAAGGSVAVRCNGFASGGGGGSANQTWLAALSLADPKMAAALGTNTYDRFHWAIDDTSESNATPFSTIDVTDYASAYGPAGYCPTGTAASGVRFVYDFASGEICESATGGGTHHAGMCRCVTATGTTFAAASLASEGQPDYWSTAVVDGGGGGQDAAIYSTDAQFNAYPTPMLRLNTYTADSCVTVEHVNEEVYLQTRDNPVFYYETVPWNYSAQQATMVETLSNMMTFIGWKNYNLTVATPGFNTYIDPAGGATPSALIEAELGNAFGIMWVGSKWWAVWINNGTILQQEVILDPVAVYGSLTNYVNNHNGGATAFAIQTDVDGMNGGRKRGAYQVTNFTDSINWHSPFVSFAMGTAGSPVSGYRAAGGQGRGWHRVIASCVATGSVSVHGRAFVTQMDVVK